MDLSVFETMESSVRTYCRAFPTVFARAVGATLFDARGRSFVDFFSGAGALNYGHNNPLIKRRVLDYLEADGIVHSLDMATEAKGEFLEGFTRVILKPRGLDYRLQFPGPTGTNAVEAAMKLARKATGRKDVVYFRGAFHGMTMGALSVSGDPARRESAGIPLDYTVEVPYEGDACALGDGLEELAARMCQASGEAELPAAVIVETIQVEGGIRAASTPWLRRLEELVRAYGTLLIVDDIQVGCGRAGTFFSFETAGLEPDLVCLSKSISGLGLPMSLVLIRPALDLWRPGEHNGTFRGQNLSFVAATEALSYWRDERLTAAVAAKARIVREALDQWTAAYPELQARPVGRGLVQGLAFGDASLARRVSRAAFERGLVVETAGLADEVLKLLPPLTIAEEELSKGLDILGSSIDAAHETAIPETVAG